MKLHLIIERIGDNVHVDNLMTDAQLDREPEVWAEMLTEERDQCLKGEVDDYGVIEIDLPDKAINEAFQRTRRIRVLMRGRRE